MDFNHSEGTEHRDTGVSDITYLWRQFRRAYLTVILVRSSRMMEQQLLYLATSWLIQAVGIGVLLERLRPFIAIQKHIVADLINNTISLCRG